MPIHRSGDKSVAFFSSYMKLILQAEIISKENLEAYMLIHFFQGDISSLGPTTLANFKEALQMIKEK